MENLEDKLNLFKKQLEITVDDSLDLNSTNPV
jgi:hypothetical protein